MRSLQVGIAAAWVLCACPSASPGGESTAVDRPATSLDDDMCKEHGVLEAVCTKCKPKLIPVFQAKGDWCNEHCFPSSFCPVCHPERGGRPNADVAKDPAPVDGTEVKFKTRETARLAGIRTICAVERPGGARLNAVATIAYDATRQATVNTRSAGIVRSIKADVGARVKQGAPLAVIESGAVAVDRSRLAAARERLSLAEAAMKMATELRENGLASSKDVLEAQQSVATARGEVAGAEASIQASGGGGEGNSYTVTSPMTGVVTRRTVTVGRMVGIAETLFEVVDVSTMWVELDVAEQDVALLRVGQPVTIAVDGLGEREFTGVLAYIAPEVDRKTRTVRARASLPNPDGALRANMFAAARIDVGGTEAVTMVPRSAVQRVKDASLVFVRISDDNYETRRVEVGPADGDAVEIRKGIKPGEDVVSVGSFMLKTETLKDSIGAGCCGVE